MHAFRKQTFCDKSKPSPSKWTTETLRQNSCNAFTTISRGAPKELGRFRPAITKCLQYPVASIYKTQLYTALCQADIR